MIIINRQYSKEIKGKNPIENPYVFAKLFRGNPYIKEITLHKETIYIEDKAFKDCKSLERINIPPKVEYLTSQMFYGVLLCVKLLQKVLFHLNIIQINFAVYVMQKTMMIINYCTSVLELENSLLKSPIALKGLT